jgi:hypothetical protein
LKSFTATVKRRVSNGLVARLSPKKCGDEANCVRETLARFGNKGKPGKIRRAA